MLSLRRASDFRRVLASGRRSRKGPLIVVSAPSDQLHPRVGLVVGKRVGKAVQRNRAKRRIRHALREISLEQGVDYVIIADRKVIDADFATLVASLRRATEGSESGAVGGIR